MTVEAVPDADETGNTVDFFGQKFRLADEISEWALMEFAESAENAESESLAGLAAIMRLLKEVVAPADWARFRATARKHKAGIAECLPIAVSVFEVKTARPTGRPADSSAGPSATEPPSMSSTAAKAIALEAGRPDLQLFIKRADEAQRAS